MKKASTFSPASMAARTSVILFIFVVVFSGLLSAAYRFTKPAIEASAMQEKMKLINEVLPQERYDNALLEDTITLPPTEMLGLSEPSTIYRARKAGEPVALIFEAIAPDGYAGKIRLILAVYKNGEVAGVRVVQHKETPGLGDYIEVKKDKNKARPWITQFTGMSFEIISEKEWKVKKDGGHFDYYAGATITPRAVTKAIQKAVKWAETHQDEMFAMTGVAQ